MKEWTECRTNKQSERQTGRIVFMESATHTIYYRLNNSSPLFSYIALQHCPFWVCTKSHLISSGWNSKSIAPLSRISIWGERSIWATEEIELKKIIHLNPMFLYYTTAKSLKTSHLSLCMFGLFQALNALIKWWHIKTQVQGSLWSLL